MISFLYKKVNNDFLHVKKFSISFFSQSVTPFSVEPKPQSTSHWFHRQGVHLVRLLVRSNNRRRIMKKSKKKH